MTVLGFGADYKEYQIYEGALGAAWFVRYGAQLVGVGRDREHAIAIAKSDRLRQEQWQRENPVFLFAA